MDGDAPLLVSAGTPGTLGLRIERRTRRRGRRHERRPGPRRRRRVPTGRRRRRLRHDGCSRTGARRSGSTGSAGSRSAPLPATPAPPPMPVRTGAWSPEPTVTLDGRASCDADGDSLTPRWELVSAPAGSGWSLDGATTWAPRLEADRVGPYRVRLVVTDANGARSLEQEVVVVAGGTCQDGMDDDLDGRIDTDDTDCDAGTG